MEGAFYLKILLGGFTRPPGDLPIDPSPSILGRKKGAATILIWCNSNVLIHNINTMINTHINTYILLPLAFSLISSRSLFKCSLYASCSSCVIGYSQSI